MKNRTKFIGVIAAVLVIAGLVLAFRPTPIAVETAAVARGPLQETVEEEGKTRMHDHFVLAAPVAGKLRRIELHAGDSVRAGQVTTFVDPMPIEPRQTAVLQARLDAAQAAQREAEALVGQTQTQNDQANIDRERTRKLFDQGVTSKEVFDRANSLASSTANQLDAAKSRAKAAAYQVVEAQSALLTQTSGRSDLPAPVTSPVGGRILRLLELSERVVVAGTPIVEIGYTPRLEVVADFLTQDAVKISPGMGAIIDDWGGDKPLRARVRMVEPGAFTKISALGVEEQRANVVLDFLEGSDKLEDAYRVEVRVITWENPSVLKVPSSAVFRSQTDWAVFKLDNGRVRKTMVQLGHRGAFEIEVLQGLGGGDIVITHPSSDIKDGARVRASLPAASK
jgi:HlyD family secretion protein